MDPADLPDDPTIADSTPLWRRIPSWHVIFDHNENRWRPSSAAFEDDPDGQPMSIAIAAAGVRSEDVLAGHANFALAAFPAGLARSLGQKVIRDPRPQEPWHGLVVGAKTKSMCRKLARQATWAVPPATPK